MVFVSFSHCYPMRLLNSVGLLTKIQNHNTEKSIKMNFKKLNRPFFFFLFALTFVACKDNKQTISVTLVNELTEKPIAGVEVGLYKWFGDTLSMLIKKSDVELVQTAICDSTGRASFVVDADEIDNIQRYFYALQQAKDTLSASSRYTLTSMVNPDWGNTLVCELYPSLHVVINLITIQEGEVYELICGNQIVEIRKNDFPAHPSFYLEPGIVHSIDIYKVDKNLKTFVGTKKMYVKHPEALPATDYVLTTYVRTGTVEIVL